MNIFGHGEPVEIRPASTSRDWIAATYDYPSANMEGWHWVRMLAPSMAQACVPDARIRRPA